jgi:hypothetical protein
MVALTPFTVRFHVISIFRGPVSRVSVAVRDYPSKQLHGNGVRIEARIGYHKRT